jgi:sugar lactone lactonase YvrE
MDGEEVDVRRAALTVLGTTVLALVGGAVSAAAPAGAEATRDVFPKVISLPNGWQPEGIATGRGTSFYVGSLRDGAIYRGSVLTGDGSVLVEGSAGQVAVGIEVDRRNRIWVAGGPTGTGRVYDAATGVELASYSFAAAGTGFVNDVVVTRDAAYFTDSVNPVLYVVPLDRNGQPGAALTLPLTGELEYTTGFNVNGIEASPDGRTLLLVQSNLGLLFTASAQTGVTEQVDLGGASLTNGDGLLRRGNTLYVVRNQRNEIAVIRLGDRYQTGSLVDTITDSFFRVPTTVAAFGPYLYAVNARFGTPPTPDTAYEVVRVLARTPTG